MGAIHKLDLTSDVTHLIVGDTDTPKYKYVAKERPDVKCLLPEWVGAVCESWMTGGYTDVRALEIRYRLSTFAGLRVCITGFDDPLRRKQLEETVKSNGGEYHGDLSKEVTHLIARTPSGHKFNYARLWAIKVVSIEWFEQSLERGMILDESLYDPVLPVQERGRNAWARKTTSTGSLGKRARENEAVPNRTRKLRRTASAKLSTHHDGIWTDIVGGGAQPERRTSVESDKSDPNSRVDSEGLSGPQIGAKRDDCSKINSIIGNRTGNQGLFEGKKFYDSILREHLRSHNAEILPDLVQLSQASTPAGSGPGYLLVPHTSSDHDIPSTPDPTPQPTVVTDMWIERCLHRKEFVLPEANITNRPFRKYPLPGFEGMVICSTAFQGVDLLHLAKVVKLMGATYDEYLTSKASVLICNSTVPNREKIRHAIEWNIPAVRADWLWDCVRHSQKKPFQLYHAFDHRNLASIFDSKESEDTMSIQIPEENFDAVNKVLQETKHIKRHERPTRSDRSFSVTSAESSIPVLDDDPKQSKNKGIAIPKAKPQSHVAHRIAPEPVDVDSETDDNLTENRHGSDAQNEPSKEVLPNPSPVNPTSPPRPPSATNLNHDTVVTNRDPVSTEIKSLLAQQKREIGNIPNPAMSEHQRPGRRKRFLGRATSNISIPSNGSIGLSRASSVDTMNTDGVGTPLEPVQPAKSQGPKDPIVALLGIHDEPEEKDEAARQNLQMTQLGYEDPEVEAWREKIIKKIGGGKDPGNDKAEGVTRVKSTRTVKDVAGFGAQGTGRRTRNGGMR